MYSKNINFIRAVPSFILHKVIYTYLKFLRFLIFFRVTCSLSKTFKLNQLSEGHQEIWEQVRKFLSCLCILNAQQIQVFFLWLLIAFILWLFQVNLLQNFSSFTLVARQQTRAFRFHSSKVPIGVVMEQLAEICLFIQFSSFYLSILQGRNQIIFWTSISL